MFGILQREDCPWQLIGPVREEESRHRKRDRRSLLGVYPQIEADTAARYIMSVKSVVLENSVSREVGIMMSRIKIRGRIVEVICHEDCVSISAIYILIRSVN